MNFTERFSERAADYAAARPAYGADALAFVLAGYALPVRVADLGAGTGISARLLADCGADVIAAEPNAAMRAQAAPHPKVRFVDGTGERTGLPDASVDVVTAFQAFHWFATPAALAEIRRIARPAGRAALALMERDESDAFGAAFGDLYRGYAVDDTEARRMRSIDVFAQLPGRVERAEFGYAQTLDREGFRARIRSSSYLPHAGAAADRLSADAEALFDRFARDGRLRIGLRTIVVRVDLP